MVSPGMSRYRSVLQRFWVMDKDKALTADRLLISAYFSLLS